MSQFKTGNDLVGSKVEYWNTNKKTGQRFRSEGIVIKYRKSKNKKQTNNYLVEFPPTINQKNTFKCWHKRSSITQID
jgi:hypothetical protein